MARLQELAVFGIDVALQLILQFGLQVSPTPSHHSMDGQPWSMVPIRVGNSKTRRRWEMKDSPTSRSILKSKPVHAVVAASKPSGPVPTRDQDPCAGVTAERRWSLAH